MSSGDETTVNKPTGAEQGSRARMRAMHELAPEEVAERFRSARTQGRPFWLWPDVPMDEWRLALAELQRIARALLVNDGTTTTLSSTVTERGLVVAAYTSGLGPWLGWHAEQGTLDAGDVGSALFAVHLEHSRRRIVRLRALLDGVMTLVANVQVRVTVLKGMHTAHAYFAEPALRPMADLDILVDDVRAMEAAFASAGYTEDRSARHAEPYRAEWRPPGVPRVLRSLTLTHADNPYAVDLHGSLNVDFFGVRTIVFDDSAQQMSVHVPSLATNAHALTQPLLAVHHAVHASHGLHGLTLLRLVELSLMLRRDMRTRSDWTQLGELLRELQAERFAYLAFALAEKLSPGTVDAALLAQLEVASPQRLRNAVRTIEPVDAQRLDGLALSERFLWAVGPREHLKRLGVMLLPTGTRGPLRRLLRIYANRGYRLLRRRVSWRDTM